MRDDAGKEKRPEVTATYGKHPFASALQISIRQAVSNAKEWAALVTTLGVLIGAYYAFETRLGLRQPWPSVFFVCAVIAFFMPFFVPIWIDLRKQKALEISGIKGELKSPTYFRLTPYEVSDAGNFSRHDGAETAVVNWIGSNSNRLLYLSGRSGVGKSSLINAVIVPKLSEANYVVVSLRPHNDLAGSISNELLRPDRIWAKPQAQAGNVVELVRRASTRVKQNGKRLLIIIDQFEEALIFGSEQAKSDFVSLVSALNIGSIDSILVMLSVATEYLSDVIDLGLPSPAFGTRENAFEVRPFTRAAAEAFVENSGLKLGAKLVQMTMAEASEIEERPDRVRPIVLNMLDLVISSFKGLLPPGVKAGSLLTGYVERSVNATPDPGISARVLQSLVTTEGAKRAQTIKQIAEDAKLPGHKVRLCLMALANDGLAGC